MNNYDGFYDDPSEFEQMIDEFKESLKKSVKQEYQEWLEFYKKENKELQDVKINLSEMKREHQEKMREYDRKIAGVRSDVRREKLDEILKELQVVLYRCEKVYKDKEKCSMCNNERQIEYMTPSGRIGKEICICANKISEYQPSENVLHEFREAMYGGKAEIVVFYKHSNGGVYQRGFYEITGCDDSLSPHKIINAGEYSGERIENTYRTLFRAKEDCQKACDVLNAEVSNDKE